jgi:hypothetical protein
MKKTLERTDLFKEVSALVEKEPYKQEVLDLMTSVRLVFLDIVVKRFSDVPTDLLLISYLDPRLTNMEGLSSVELTTARARLINAAISMAAEEDIQRAADHQPRDGSAAPVEETSSLAKSNGKWQLRGSLENEDVVAPVTTVRRDLGTFELDAP